MPPEVLDAPVEVAAPEAPAADPSALYDMVDPAEHEPAPEAPAPKAAKSPREARRSAKPQVKPQAKSPAPIPELDDPGDPEPAESSELADPELEPPVAQPAGNADLLKQAEFHGIAKADAEALDKSGALEAVLTALDRQNANRFRPEAAKPTEQPKPAEQPLSKNAADGAKPQANAPAATALLAEKYKVDLDPADYDEGTIKVLNGLNDHYHTLAEQHAQELAATKAETAALREQLNSVTGRFQAEDQVRFATDMNMFFDSLGDGFRDTFGQGAMSNLAQDSAATKNRQAIVAEMQALQLADVQLGRQSSVADLQQRALRLLHSETIAQHARAKSAQAVESRRGQAVARPTSRQAAAKTPRERARQFEREFIRDHGGMLDDSPDDI